MAQLLATGPVSIWVGVGSSHDGRPQFLGHGERAPTIEVTPKYHPFYSDAGGLVPHEMLYAGSSARISVDLNRYNFEILEIIQDRPRGSFFPVVIPGYDDAGQIGTPMVTNGCAYPLYLMFPFFVKPAYASPEGPNTGGPLPAGYRFVAAFLDPERCVMGTTSAKKVHLEWMCLRKRDYSKYNPFGRGSMLLYDKDVSAAQGLLEN